MSNQINVVIHKECHSRGILSGILSTFKNTRWGSPIKTLGDDFHQCAGMTLDRIAVCGFVSRRHPEFISGSSRYNNKMLKQVQHDGNGFTLIELLVVVLIVGILAAVALPQYQKAVLKSRYAALMPITKSIANGNEAYYLEHGVYATSPASLDVVGQDEYPDGAQIDIQPDDSEQANEDYNFVIASRDNNFPLNYLVYQNHSPKFAGNIHCEADENNTMAQEICQSLGGQYIAGSQTDGFMTYVLSGNIGSDTLPTSLNKLAANLQQSQCVGKTNCTATVQGNQVAVTECKDRFVWAVIHGIEKTDNGCLTTYYNSESTETLQIFEACFDNFNATKHICAPIGSGGSRDILSYRDPQTGNVVGYLSCFNLKDGQCQGISRGEYKRDSSGKTISAPVLESLSCPSGQFVNLAAYYNLGTLECID